MPIEKAIIRYCCSICSTDFKTLKEAENCENRKNEELPAWVKVGKEVVTDLYCGHCRAGYTIGRITKIVGPVIPDEEHEIHFVRRPGRRMMHVYYLHIASRCGACKRRIRFIKGIPNVQENKRF